MYHRAKSGKRHHRRNHLLKLCFFLTGLWALALLLLAGNPSILTLAESGGEVLLVYRGESRRVPAGQTPAELLSRLGLTVSGEDVLSQPLDAVLTPGTRFTVERRQTRQETYTVSLPFEKEYRLDSTQPWGMETVLAEGIPGEIRCTAQVDYVNGIEVHREITQEELLRPVQNELIAVGTCENPAPTAGNGYLWLPEGQLLTYTHTATAQATGFTAADPGGIAGARPGTVAADPDFIAPGTRLYIVSADGAFVYGIAQAQASESMEGRRIDLFFPTAEAQAEFGRRACTVYFLG